MRKSAGMTARSSLRRAGTCVLIAAAALLSACSTNNDTLPQNTLDPEGPIARQLDQLWDPVFLIAGIIFVLVQGLILICVLRFRSKSEDEAPVQVHGNVKLELAWTIIPAVLLAVIGFFTVVTIFDINEKQAGADTFAVKVIGHQWWWEYQYPSLDIVTANELHIPTGQRINVELTAEDVIHSFWVPKLAGKVDTVPGRSNFMQLEADQPGTYFGQCGEYCGLSHGNMKLTVVAHAPDDFEEWARGQRRAAPAPSGGQAAAGAEVFGVRACGTCHTVDGLEGAEGKVGPNLTHLFSRKVFAGAIFDLNEKNLRKWLRNPPKEKPMMPDDGIGMPDLGLSEEEITQLIAYLETLR